MKKIVKLTESDLIKIVKKVLSENQKKGDPLKVGFDLKTMHGVMAFQDWVLQNELSNSNCHKDEVTKFYPNLGVCYVNKNNCKWCDHYKKHLQYGENCCKISGSTLCSKQMCKYTEMVDGVFGPQTKKAYEKYVKNKHTYSTNFDKTKHQFASSDSLYYHLLPTDLSDQEKYYKPNLIGQQIPVTMDQIKAFQLFYFLIETYKDKTNCEKKCKKNCKYKTKLCGGTCCTMKKAIDGIWGGNTIKLWNENKNLYLSWNKVDTSYETIKKNFKNQKTLKGFFDFYGKPFN